MITGFILEMGSVMKVVISACLLGFPVRYDGGAKTSRAVQEFASKVEAMPMMVHIQENSFPVRVFLPVT